MRFVVCPRGLCSDAFRQSFGCVAESSCVLITSYLSHAWEFSYQTSLDFQKLSRLSPFVSVHVASKADPSLNPHSLQPLKLFKNNFRKTFFIVGINISVQSSFCFLALRNHKNSFCFSQTQTRLHFQILLQKFPS